MADKPEIITREQWGACGSVPLDPSDKDEIAIHHSVSPNKQWTKAQEIEHLKGICEGHLARGFQTIGYSFMVFPSGRIYSGRGWHGLPAATEDQNTGTWALCGIGDFRSHEELAAAGLSRAAVDPPLEMRRSLRALIVYLRDSAFAAHHLGGHREFPGQSTECPGARMLEFVRKWRVDFDLSGPERS